MKASKAFVAVLATLGLAACGGRSTGPAQKTTAVVVQGNVQALTAGVSAVALTLDGATVEGSPFTVTSGHFGPVSVTVAPGSHTFVATATAGESTLSAMGTVEATFGGPNSVALYLFDPRAAQDLHSAPVVQSITASPAALTVVEGPAPVTPTSTLSSSVVSFEAGAVLSYAWTDSCNGTFDPADGASPVYTPPAYVDSLTKTCTIELTASASGVSDPVFSKATTTIAVSYIIPNAMTATLATATFDEKDVVAGDSGAPGFGTGSFASGGTSKTDIHLLGLFEGDVTLGDIAGMSYWTKKDTTHAVNVADWFLAIYTKPYAGQVSGWYGQRINAEPYFAKNLNDPANTWNQWSTNGAQNQLRFYESTYNYFGASTDLDWASFVEGNSLAGARGPSLPYASQPILYISIQTGSTTANGFTGELDGFQIWLKDGRSATVNFEP